VLAGSLVKLGPLPGQDPAGLVEVPATRGGAAVGLVGQGVFGRGLLGDVAQGLQLAGVLASFGFGDLVIRGAGRGGQTGRSGREARPVLHVAARGQGRPGSTLINKILSNGGGAPGGGEFVAQCGPRWASGAQFVAAGDEGGAAALAAGLLAYAVRLGPGRVQGGLGRADRLGGEAGFGGGRGGEVGGPGGGPFGGDGRVGWGGRLGGVG
jgi:hypothetical protein